MPIHDAELAVEPPALPPLPVVSAPAVPDPVSPESDGRHAALTEGERGVAGTSARAERRRRSQKREERVRAKHPRLGGLLLAVSDDPTSTKVWDQGALGEERVGAFLDAARPEGIEVLHDRRIPKSRANIDHVVVAPTGVWIVDTKRYLNGRLEPRVVGRRRERQVHLFVGSRDKTNLVVAMHKQVGLVRAALADTAFARVPVHGALCFVEAEVGYFAKPWVVQGVHVTWRKHLLRPMLTAGPDAHLLGGDEVQALARALADRFKPA